MINKFTLILIALIVIACSVKTKNDPLSLYSQLGKNAPPNTLTEKEKNNGWQLLFDGQNPTGWHGYNMAAFPDCWMMEETALTMTTEGSGESQDIITDKMYKSFAFSLEFKLSKGANSGIIFQVIEDTIYKFPYEPGPNSKFLMT